MKTAAVSGLLIAGSGLLLLTPVAEAPTPATAQMSKRNSSLAPSCDYKLVEALKTRSTTITETSLAAAAKQAACDSKDRSLGIKKEGYGSLDAKDVQQACDSKDQTFFQKNSRLIVTSYLSAESIGALKTICRPATGLSLEATEAGSQIQLRASWQGVGDRNQFAVIRNFGFPASVVSCRLIGFKPGTRFSAGSAQQTCTRKTDAPAIFTLQTDQGTVSSVSAKARPKPKYVLEIEGADDSISCNLNGNGVAATSGGNPVTVSLTPQSGSNSLVCVPHDDHPDGNFNPCWSYSFRLKAGQEVATNRKNSCCGSGCKAQPDPETFTFDY